MKHKFHIRQLNQDSVPTTSLADMMFLLLIFFIMTTTLAKTTGLITDIPTGTKGQPDTTEKTPSVALHGDKMAVNDKDMSIEEFKVYVKALRFDLRKGDAKVVTVEATGPVPYQNYFEVLSIVQNASGIVALVSEEGDGK